MRKGRNMVKLIKRILYKLYKKIFKPKTLRRKKVAGICEPISNYNADKSILSYEGLDDEIFTKISDDAKNIFKDIKKEDKVHIKINLNTRHDYPASTDPKMLNLIIDCLISLGVHDITVGDCCTVSRLPTRREYRKSKLYKAIDEKVKLVFYDEEDWFSVKVGGEYLDEVTLPKSVFEADKIIYLANLKTHWLSDFSMSLKLAVGVMHPIERLEMHKSNLNEKIAEISLAIQPSLIILDARKAFVMGGPHEGDVANGKSVFIGKDLLSVDTAGYNLLYSLKSERGCIKDFKKNPYDMPQLKHLKKINERNKLK